MAKGDLVETEANRRSGDALLRARELLGKGRTRPMSQPQFLKLLGTALALEVPPSQSSYSEWEGGQSTVPAAILVAAAQIVSERRTPTPIDALLMGQVAFDDWIVEKLLPVLRQKLERLPPPELTTGEPT